MAILCLEGPSAVGKTTTAAALAAAGAHVVPEANVLFTRPAEAEPEWYFERQVERWALASRAAREHDLVVLDGDPFQPLWYSWSYGYAGWQPLEMMEAFYRPRIERGDIGWPDRYVVLGAPEAVLRQRKAADAGRRRGSFDEHLRFIEPQRRYFRAMESFSPGSVRFAEAGAVGDSVRAVHRAALDAEPEPHPLQRFDRMVDWLRRNAADG
jgi:hypothetical protein